LLDSILDSIQNIVIKEVQSRICRS